MNVLRQGLGRSVLVLSVVVSLAGACWARQGVVTTKDGREFTGEVVKDDLSGVTLIISGIEMFLQREDIDRVVYPMTVEEQYAARRAELSEDDADAWYRLMSWLFESQAYTLARKELELFVKRHPGDSRAQRLSTIIEAKLKLIEQEKVRPDLSVTPPVEGGPDTETPGPDVAHGGQAERWLTLEQINLIKVWELDLSEEPSVIVPKDVAEELFERYREDERVPRGRKEQVAFYALPGYKQLETIFAVTARELYGRVQVRGNPPVMQKFRAGIHNNYVLNHCGTIRCHGRPDAAGLQLIRAQPTSERTIYTNFFILQAARSEHGRVINRQEVERSLLLQYALPRDVAVKPHPEVPGWRPGLPNADNQRYQMVSDWIAGLQLDPKYGIGYSQRTPSGEPASEVTPAESEAVTAQ